MFFKSVASCMFINKYKSLWAAKLDLTGKKKEEEEGGEGEEGGERVGCEGKNDIEDVGQG